jgi:hypothetical protein
MSEQIRRRPVRRNSNSGALFFRFIALRSIVYRIH